MTQDSGRTYETYAGGQLINSTPAPPTSRYEWMGANVGGGHTRHATVVEEAGVGRPLQADGRYRPQIVMVDAAGQPCYEDGTPRLSRQQPLPATEEGRARRMAELEAQAEEAEDQRLIAARVEERGGQMIRDELTSREQALMDSWPGARTSHGGAETADEARQRAGTGDF